MTILRYIFAVILLIFGVVTSYAMLTKAYDPQNKGIMLFGETFRNLHNAIMMSYMVYFVRLSQLLVGILLLTKRYWWIGLLIYLPFSVNIFFIHIIHDMPPVNAGFFTAGMIVSVLNFVLVFYERDRLKQLVVRPSQDK